METQFRKVIAHENIIKFGKLVCNQILDYPLYDDQMKCNSSIKLASIGK